MSRFVQAEKVCSSSIYDHRNSAWIPAQFWGVLCYQGCPWLAILVEPCNWVSMTSCILKLQNLRILSCIRFITTFVTVFAVVIAITKDLPDVDGDRANGIETFATRMGVRNVSLFSECIDL